MSKIQDLIDDLFFVVAEYIRVNNQTTLNEHARDSLIAKAKTGEAEGLRTLMKVITNPDRVNQLNYLLEFALALTKHLNDLNWDKIASYSQRLLNNLNSLCSGKPVVVKLPKDNSVIEVTLGSLQRAYNYNNRLGDLVNERIIHKHRWIDIEEIINAEKDKLLAVVELQKLKHAYDEVFAEKNQLHASVEELTHKLEKAKSEKQLASTATQTLLNKAREGRQQAQVLGNQTGQQQAMIHSLEERIQQEQELNQKLQQELNLEREKVAMKNKLLSTTEEARDTFQQQINKLEAELSEAFNVTRTSRQETASLKKVNQELAERLRMYVELFAVMQESQQPLKPVDDKEKVRALHAQIVTAFTNALKNTQVSELFISKGQQKLKNSINTQLRMLFKFLEETGSKDILKETYFCSRVIENGNSKLITLIDYFSEFFSDRCNKQIPSWIDTDLAQKFSEYKKNGYQVTAYANQLKLVNRIGALANHSSNGAANSVEAAVSGAGPSCPNN